MKFWKQDRYLPIRNMILKRTRELALPKKGKYMNWEFEDFRKKKRPGLMWLDIVIILTVSYIISESFMISDFTTMTLGIVAWQLYERWRLTWVK